MSLLGIGMRMGWMVLMGLGLGMMGCMGRIWLGMGKRRMMRKRMRKRRVH